ncbi:MAG: ABC transporter ATP-binding protein, partial [Lachnospiraceae bacterium]|nr:ABC transporter ATP-binding protein [Lachnospiraceae bacterium]
MIKTLAAQIKEYKKVSIMTPVFMILEVVFEMLLPFLMASIIDDGVEAGNMRHIYAVGAVMIAAALCGLLCGVMGGKYGARASTGFAKNLRQAMFENIQTFSFSSLDKFSTAGLVTRLTTDITNMQMAYQMILRICFRAPVSMICAMTMAFLINARLAAVYLVAVVLLAIVLFAIIRGAMKYFKQAFPKYDELNASVQENVSAIRVVKAYVREEHETRKFKSASQGIYDIFMKAEKQVVLNMPVMMFTVYGCIMLVSWLGAKQIVQNTLTTGELMSLLTYCMNILMSLMMVAMIFVMISMSIASAERICEVLEEKSDLTNPADPVYEVKNGEIEFRHVRFSYH